MNRLTEAYSLNTLAKDWADAGQDIDAKVQIINAIFGPVFKTPPIRQDPIELVGYFESLLSEMGATVAQNPILAFLSKFTGKLTLEQLQTVQNCYEQGIISEDALRGVSPDGRAHLVFNKPLYAENEGSMDGLEFLFKAYSWLSKPSNINAYANRKAMNINGERMDIEAAAKGQPAALRRLRDGAIYSSRRQSIMSAVRSPDEVQSILNDIASRPDKRSEYRNAPGGSRSVEIRTSPRANWSWTATSPVDKSKLSRAELLDYVSYLLSGI